MLDSHLMMTIVSHKAIYRYHSWPLYCMLSVYVYSRVCALFFAHRLLNSADLYSKGRLNSLVATNSISGTMVVRLSAVPG